MNRGIWLVPAIMLCIASVACQPVESPKATSVPSSSSTGTQLKSPAPSANSISPSSKSNSIEPKSSTDPKGQIRTTDTPASGRYHTSSISIAPINRTAKINKYLVKVETTVKVDANAAAKEIQSTLDDKRSWVGYGKNSFELVANPANAQFTIYIASAKTADQLCAPMKTDKKWNCRNGKSVVFNSDRWLYMTPTYSDLTEYRHYLVNHEIGHYIGLGHVSCPKPGGLAPTMMQQSIDLGGCKPNPWPKLSS